MKFLLHLCWIIYLGYYPLPESVMIIVTLMIVSFFERVWWRPTSKEKFFELMHQQIIVPKNIELMSQVAIVFLKSKNEYLWPATINIDQWFEYGVNAHVHHETNLWAPAEMLTESKIEDRSNETYSLGHEENLVAPNRATRICVMNCTERRERNNEQQESAPRIDSRKTIDLHKLTNRAYCRGWAYCMYKNLRHKLLTWER